MELLTQVRDLSRIGYGFMASTTLFSALDLDIFSNLADGPLSVEEIQQRTQAASNGLHTLLRACASLGLIGQEGELRFEAVQWADLLPGMTGLVSARRPP